MKKALITGIGGQDGSYLARFLIGKGYEVFGTSRDAEQGGFSGLKALGLEQSVQLFSVNLNDFRSVLQCLVKVAPDEVYNLAIFLCSLNLIQICILGHLSKALSLGRLKP